MRGEWRGGRGRLGVGDGGGRAVELLCMVSGEGGWGMGDCCGGFCEGSGLVGRAVRREWGGRSRVGISEMFH